MTTIIVSAVCLLLMMCVLRKKFSVPFDKMLGIYACMAVLGAIGARLGSVMGEMSVSGLRLYGLMALDTISLFVLSRVFRMKIGALGDYLAVPVIAAFSAAKIMCVIYNCCYGIILYQSSEKVVRFPSQIVETLMWAILAIWLYVVAEKKQLDNLLWSIATIWFGILRFLVDFLRGSPGELELKILGLYAGRFWSLIVLAIGIGFMIFSFRKYRAHTPTVGEMLQAVFGITPQKKKSIV